MEIKCNITDLSHELICEILRHLPLREVLSVGMLCKKLSTAVDLHLRLCKSIDFCQDAVCGYMPSSITDDNLLTLLQKCPHLEIIYGLHPVKIERRRLRKRSALSIPGIIEALNLCFHLKAIETSDLRLFEAIMQHLPQIEIIGHFQNRDGLFPPQASQRLKLQPYPRISSLHLIGVEIPELTVMSHMQHLHLQCVRFTKLQPFRAFLAPNLKSFVMKHCIGPSVPERYLSLIIALGSSPNLSHLELVRVPLLNGLFQRAVEDSYRHNGFVNLKTLVFAGCKGILEADLGHLMIVASKNLETLYIQPSLTKDSLFVSLSYAQCSFPKLQNLHLGYVDNLSSSGEWTNDALISFGLAEVPDTPSSITDSGMKVINSLFPFIKTLSISNCPHLMIMYEWMPREGGGWSKLTDLTLQKCHCLQLSTFTIFLSFLRNIQVVVLNDMFREPPKGCSHVGLSAGTGLGMSSAVVSNQDEHIAVQGHQQDFEHPGDEENEENEREFIDVENDDNPDQFMILQRDFFDGEEEEDADVDIDVDIFMEDLERVAMDEVLSEEYDSSDDNSNNEHSVDERNNGRKHISVDIHENGSSALPVPHGQSVDGNISRYNLRQTNKKSSRSVYIHSSNLNKERNTLNSEETLKDDVVMHDDMDSNHVQKYDPHKPSTSKAGRHLDYSASLDAKPYNIDDSESDSDYKYGSTSKQMKRSTNRQSSVSCKRLVVVLTRCDENLLSKDSNNCEKNSNVIPEFEMHSSAKAADIQPSIAENDHSNFKLEVTNSTTADVATNSNTPKEMAVDFTNSNFSNSSEEELSEIFILKKSDSEVDMQTALKNSKEINSSLNDNFSKYKCDSINKLGDDTHLKTGVSRSFVKTEEENVPFDFTYENTESNNLKSSDVTNNMQISAVSPDHEEGLQSNISEMSNFSSEMVYKRSSMGSSSNSENFWIYLDDSCKETEDRDNCNQNSKLETGEVNDSTNTSLNVDQNNLSELALEELKECIDNNINSDSLCINTEKSKNKVLDHVNVNENRATEFRNSISKDIELPIDDVSMLSELKPCCDLASENDKTHSCTQMDCSDEHKSLVEKNDQEGEILLVKSISIKTENPENLQIHDPYQPSTSNSGIGIHNKCSRKLIKCNKRTQTCYEHELSTVNTKNNHDESLQSGSNLANETSDSGRSEMQNMKNVSHDESYENNNLKSDLNLSSKRRKIKKSSDDHIDEYKYYALVQRDSCKCVEIVHSSTGMSYRIPSCKIVVSKISSENCTEVHSKSKVKNRCKSNTFKKLNDKNPELNSGFKPNLPSTSKHNINIDHVSETSNLHATRSRNAVSQKSTSNDKEIETSLSDMKSKKKVKKNKCVSKEMKKSENISIRCSKNEKDEVLEVGKASSVVPVESEKLKIKNTDAALLIRRSHSEVNRTDVYIDTDVEKIFISSNSDEEVKNDIGPEKHSLVYQDNNDIVSKNHDSPLSFENGAKSVPHTRKRRRKKFGRPKKKAKKCSKEFSVKSDSSNRCSARNISRRILSVPMVCLVSQGTQANSADIRRSVRRIRRSTARYHRAASFICLSRSSHSSKISSKMLHKVPASKNPRPESHDKATSTSDPLLEEDAIQVLLLTSSSLLSFTMVSCGISDLIIETCPKLFHVEVQACRIFKKLELNNCPSLEKLNISQCPKLNICALVDPVLSLKTTSKFLLVSYEPCMQGYHHGEGEKAILSRAALSKSVLICHNFSDISLEVVQAKFKEKLEAWLRHLSVLERALNYTQEQSKKRKEKGRKRCSEYPWSHDIQRIHGEYIYPPTSDFCVNEGRYQLLTNNRIFCDFFETRRNKISSVFPSVKECKAYRDSSLLSHEAVTKYMQMDKKFVGFYIPITENNQINFCK